MVCACSRGRLAGSQTGGVGSTLGAEGASCRARCQVSVRVGEVAVGASWDLSAGTVRWSPGPALTLAGATLGLGLNLRAWILLSPLLAGRRDVGLGTYVVLMGLPLLVAALARLPVGVLTDRWGRG